MKKIGDIKKFYYYAFPMQALLVTSTDKNGNTNIITIAWYAPISKKPPLFGISVAPQRHSHKLIEESKEFVVNFAPYDLVEKVNFCGTHSGRNTDKIKETGLTLIPSQKVKTKSIKECYAHLECKLYDNKVLGDHSFIIGEVLNIRIDENSFPEAVLDNKNIKPCYYLGSNIYTTISDKKEKI